MLSPKSIKPRGYADRPVTPLGEGSGLTSAPVSQLPSRTSSPKTPDVDPYRYQPAINSSRPQFTAPDYQSSNYARACFLKFVAGSATASEGRLYRSKSSIDEAAELSHIPRVHRAYSFSAEDLESRMTGFDEVPNLRYNQGERTQKR